MQGYGSVTVRVCGVGVCGRGGGGGVVRRGVWVGGLGWGGASRIQLGSD